MDANAYDGLYAALVAVAGTLGGVWIAHHFSQRQWLSQHQWAAREKHYMELLRHLAKARLSLEEQEEYFQGGSDYDDFSKDVRFARLSTMVSEALNALRELAGPARVFLSEKAIAALEEVAQAEYHAHGRGIAKRLHRRRADTSEKGRRGSVGGS